MARSRTAREEEARRQQDYVRAQEQIAEEQRQRAEAEQQRAVEAEAHARYAEAGRRRSKRLAIIAASLALVAALAAGVTTWSWWQADRALQRAITAEAAEKAARNEAQLGDSLFRAVQARNQIEDGLPVTAMQLALAGLPANPAMLLKPAPGSARRRARWSRQWALSASYRSCAAMRDRCGPRSFPPDGARIVSGSDDKTVRVWDAASGDELLVLRGHEGPVWAAGFSAGWRADRQRVRRQDGAGVGRGEREGAAGPARP